MSKSPDPSTFEVQQQALALARGSLLESADLGDPQLDRAMGALMRAGVDWGDLYFSEYSGESWVLEDGIVKTASHDRGRGMSARAVSGEKSGFAYSDDLDPATLLRAAKTAGAIARGGGRGRIELRREGASRRLYAAGDPGADYSDTSKVELLHALDREARAADTRVRQVIASLSIARNLMLVCSSDGRLAADERPLVRLGVTVLLEQNGEVRHGVAGWGGRLPLADLVAADSAGEYAREAVRQAVVNLDAEPAPAGEEIVVLGPGWPGVLLHEAVGHGLEGDFNRKGVSAFAGRIGEAVATDQCTVVDDGSMPGRRGSLEIDDEGTPTGRTVLIENGVLAGYMQDRLNAGLMGVRPTGNGRRESYAHLPMPRMTNTFMMPGPHDPEEIIRSVKKGVYAKNFGGGQVDITSGKFVFSASEAYRIEDGRLGAPLRDATLIGDGPTVLTRVSMVGSDLALDPGVGVCGKDGQTVPVGVGMPTVRVDGITVGGTA
ncbi:MAG: metalloprotease TldD [Gammaproteobacteria bacterium]|nr:metalloprotease TldD [Gammaproteobacteria bacterium]MYH34233.1 metalloprotease TldD [Gammaproteobacteria bacterium]MYL01364.1 metalloprotease TldD [Gammaproteobacteria bacterium]